MWNMWKQLSTVSALALALSATPALAQQGTPSTEPADEVQQGSSSELQEPTAAEQLGDPTGLDVYSFDGQKIGVVAAARAKPEADLGSIEPYEAIWVEVGGFLGLGEKTVMLTADQWTRGQADGQIQMNLTADQAAQLPESQPQ